MFTTKKVSNVIIVIVLPFLCGLARYLFCTFMCWTMATFFRVHKAM